MDIHFGQNTIRKASVWLMMDMKDRSGIVEINNNNSS